MGGEVRGAGIVKLEITAKHLACQLCFHEPFVQSTGWCVAEGEDHEIERGEVGVGARWHVIGRHHPLHIAHAPNGDGTFTVLIRFRCIESR